MCTCKVSRHSVEAAGVTGGVAGSTTANVSDALKVLSNTPNLEGFPGQ
jgi:hypothetical protein